MFRNSDWLCRVEELPRRRAELCLRVPGAEIPAGDPHLGRGVPGGAGPGEAQAPPLRAQQQDRRPPTQNPPQVHRLQGIHVHRRFFANFARKTAKIYSYVR